MATNAIKALATSPTADVLTQGEYEALADLGTGYPTGILSRRKLNKTLRQTTLMSAALAQFVANAGYSVGDDMTTSAVAALLESTILSSPGSSAGLAADLASAAYGKGADLVAGVGRTVDSVAALRALSHTRPAAFVLGYYASGDGGGGKYRYDPADTSSADNGGTVIVAADGARWKLIHGGKISIRQFGARGNGVSDDAPPFRATVDYCVQFQYTVTVPTPPVWYLVKSSIPIYNGTIIEGHSAGQFTEHYSQVPKFSHIHYFPTTAGTDLFVPVAYGHTDPFTEHVSVSGIYVSGGVGARFAFNNAAVIYSTFRDIGCTGWVAGFNIQLSIQNRYENILIKGSSTAPVIYSSSSDVATTDVWDQCTFFSAPQGPYLQGCVGIRFTNCIWEQLDNYGLNMARDCHNIEVIGGYSEDVPYANNASGSMFRVGHDAGTGLPVDVALRVVGGTWNGRNAGTVGAFLDCNYTNGVVITGVTHNRYTSIVKTTANTRNDSIVWVGSNGFGFSSFANDMTKISGMYPNGVLNTGSNAQHMRLPSLFTNNIDAADGTGSGLTLGASSLVFKIGAAHAAYPAVDNADDLGIDSNRWRSVSAGIVRVSAAASAAAPGRLTLGSGTTTAATAGGATALPATPLGYFTWYLGGTPVKIAYYNA